MLGNMCSTMFDDDDDALEKKKHGPDSVRKQYY
jgi:hypothetical protein